MRGDMEPDIAVEQDPNDTEAKYEKNVMCDVEPTSAAGKLLNLFLTARFARRNQEAIWMTANRNVRAKYGPEVQLQDGWSKAFVNLTSPKIQTATAIVNDVILPQGKDIWDLESTPEPFMPEFTAFLAKQNAEQGIDADFGTFKNQIFLESQRRTRNLKSKVRDGFVESDFRTELSRATYDLILYGNLCCMGPFQAERKRKPRPGKKVKSYKYPEWNFPSLFDIYPDPGARSEEDCLYFVYRRVPNKAWLSQMRNDPGFKKEIINEVLELAPDGNWTPEPWETDLIITNNNNQMYTYRHRFVVYDFWMKQTGKEMMELGCDEKEIDQEDLNKMYTANIMITNGRVIRAVTSEFHEDRLPVYLPGCRRNTHSIWSTGIAEMMFDSQASASACERALNDNMASIARPQTVLDMSRLKMGTTSCNPCPGKIWYTNNAAGHSSKVVDIFFPPNIIKEILERQAADKKWADEETGVPSFLMGNNEGGGTHNRTLGGAELQWNNANNPFKTIVTNIENGLIVPVTDKMIDYYLTYEYSDEIDADYKISSTGLQGLVAKQARVQAIMEFLKAVGNNEYWQHRINDKRVGEILEDAFQLTGEQLFLNDVDAAAKAKKLAEEKANTPPNLLPDTPPTEAALKFLAATDKGTPMYPIALEHAWNSLVKQDNPAADAAMHIMRQESLTAHRQFVDSSDVAAIGAPGKNEAPSGPPGVPPQLADGPTPPGWQPGQPGSIPTQTAPQAGPAGVIHAPLPLGVKSLGTPDAQSLVQHPERYGAEIPPGKATNPADVGGMGLPNLQGAINAAK